MKLKWIRNGLLLLLLIYFLYCIIGGIASYIWPKQADFPVDVTEFYGDVAGADSAALVETPEEAFARRIELIRSAKETLDISYHCVKEGESVDCIFAEVLKAAQRGVQVHILMDGKVSGMSGEHGYLPAAMAAHPNIQYRIYNPVDLLRPWRWNALLHDKFIIADDSGLLLGGRNLGDEYFAPPDYAGKLTYDRDVLVLRTGTGESVIPKVRAYMDILWEAKETVTPRFSEGKLQKGRAKWPVLLETATAWEHRYPDYYLPKMPAADVVVPTNRITLVNNPVEPYKKEPVIWHTLGELLKTGKQVDIQSPYTTAAPMTLQLFREIAENAEGLRLLTNSMASSPNYPAFSAYHYERKRFLKTGAELYEYQNTASIHGKSCLMDGRISVVGSFNLDDRSIYIDTETILIIDSEEFNRQLSMQFDTLYERCAKVGEDNDYVAEDAAKVLEVPGKKRTTMWLFSLFSRAFRFLI